MRRTRKSRRRKRSKRRRSRRRRRRARKARMDQQGQRKRRNTTKRTNTQKGENMKNILRYQWACLLVACLTSQQQASVSQGRICSDNFTCCHTEIEVADPTFYLTQSQYTDTGPTSPSADPITPGAWQDSHWSASF